MTKSANLFLFLGLFLIVKCTTPSQNQEEAQVYKEPHRPQFHFSPESGWMNDPNGMVFYEGEFHLFYQFYPNSTVWGPMHWGHAVSTDLIHWEHLPIGLYPDSLGYIYSGSAVVDWKNTSGFGSEDNPPLVAIYTHHDIGGEFSGTKDYQTQAIAFSLDKGRSWTKFQGNPVLPNPGIKDFRDPKVFWHEASQKWVMILAVDDHAQLFGSSDLKQWEKLSEFGIDQGHHGGVWECPDLFALPVQGTDQEKWVMIISLGDGGPNIGSATQYFIGEFDGEKFVNDNPGERVLWLDYGRDNYAGVTWSDVPNSDGRSLFIGWMSNWKYARFVPTAPWRSAMTIPRKLGLRKTPNGIRLISQPVPEISSIRSKTIDLEKQTIEDYRDLTGLLSFDPAISEISLEFESFETSTNLGLEISNDLGQKILLGYEPATKILYVDRTMAGDDNIPGEFARRDYAPRLVNSDVLKLHILLDVSSVEMFVDDGLVVFTDLFFPSQKFNKISLYTDNGPVDLKSGSVTELKSIWN